MRLAELKIQVKSYVKWQKSNLEKGFFSNLQTSFCTSFTEIDTAPKGIKLQRSAWSQIKAF